MHEGVVLDSFDVRLLIALQDSGRLSNQEMGERIGLSPSQCSRRRAVLESSGIIQGYRAQLSAQALGFHLLVIVQVTLKAHSDANARRFRDLVERVNEIQEAYALTGKADYHLKCVVRDLEDLSRLISDVLLAHDSVARVRSAIVLQRLKETTKLPLRAN